MSSSHEDPPLGAMTLHGEEDHNGNAFPISSSSSASSSCSSSRMGESSPESLRSLSSLSGERTRSPLDYDMLEVTVVARVTTPQEKTSTLGDISTGRTRTSAETTESNDNSLSVYLDAYSEYHRELWNDNDSRTLALLLDTSSSGDSGAPRGANNRQPDSSCPDSDATEIPVDDDEDEEVSFLSVSSDLGLCKSGVIRADGSSSVAITVDVLAEVEARTDVKVLDLYSPSPAQTEVPPPPLEVAVVQQDEASGAAKTFPRNSQQDPKLVQHPTTSPRKAPTQVIKRNILALCGKGSNDSTSHLWFLF